MVLVQILILLYGLLHPAGRIEKNEPPASGAGAPAQERRDGSKGAKREKSIPRPEGRNADGFHARELPKSVQLPEAGEYKARELFSIAEKLAGCPVIPASKDPAVEESIVEITVEIAGHQTTLDELTILLGAHGIYLFPLEKKDGRVLVASRDPNWKPSGEIQPFFRKTFQVRMRDFDPVQEEIQKYLEKKNNTKLPHEPMASMAADPRTCRIIVFATSERTIAGVEEIVFRLTRPKVETPNLHSFKPRHRAAKELEKELLEQLRPGQIRRMNLVVPRGKNILLIRAPDDLYEEVRGILETLDSPQRTKKVRQKVLRNHG